jgi:hypothetical protein
MFFQSFATGLYKRFLRARLGLPKQRRSGKNTVGVLAAFGLFSVTAMLVFYGLEKRSHWFILAFAGSCLLGSIYGFLQGAWPFGLVECVWSLVAVRRWWIERI